MAQGVTATRTMYVVRVRETQEYDIDIEVAASGTSRDAAKAARLRFLGMTVVDQASNSIGVTARTFGIGEDDFDEDELAEDV